MFDLQSVNWETGNTLSPCLYLGLKYLTCMLLDFLKKGKFIEMYKQSCLQMYIFDVFYLLA